MRDHTAAQLKEDLCFLDGILQELLADGELSEWQEIRCEEATKLITQMQKTLEDRQV